MDWYPSVPNFTEPEWTEYEELIENFGRWAGNVEHVVHTINFKSLTDTNHNFIFDSNLRSTE